MAKHQQTDLYLLISAIILFLPLVFLSLYYHRGNRQEFKTQVLGKSSTSFVVEEDLFWKDYLTQHPNYFPGWLELAKIKLEENNLQDYQAALQKAQQLNPNSDEVKQLLRAAR